MYSPTLQICSQLGSSLLRRVMDADPVRKATLPGGGLSIMGVQNKLMKIFNIHSQHINLHEVM